MMMILFSGASGVVVPPTGTVKQPTSVSLDSDGSSGVTVTSGQTSVIVDSGEASTTIES